METLHYKRYLLFSGLVALLLLTGVAALNYVIDPFNLIGNNSIGVYFVNERQSKNAILTYEHEAILIGSSKTGYVDPESLACYKFYNASIRALLPEEMYFYLKKYLRNEKLVLIGFDFYMFNEREFPLVQMDDWDTVGYKPAEYLLGYHTLKSSLESIKKWKKKEVPADVLKANGQFIFPSVIQERSAEDLQKIEKKRKDIIKGLMRNHYGGFFFSRKRMDVLRKLKAFLEEKQIPYAVFINPLHHDVIASLQKLDAYELFITWKQEMKTIFPDIYDYSIGHYSEDQWFYREDPYHYTIPAGQSFLNEIISHYCPKSSSP